MSISTKVSVIMPAFNCGRYIREAMTSVIAQTYKDFELIVVDDGSKDDTKRAVSDFIAGNRRYKIKYIYQENKGTAGARNTGIANSCGEYLAFLDCDDVWLPHKLEVQVPVLENDAGAGLVFGGTASFGEVRAQPPASETQDLSKLNHNITGLFAGSYISTLTVMIRKACLEKAGSFDEALSIVEDYDLWLRIAKYYGLVYVDSLVAKYRVHPGNISRVTKENEEKLLLDLIKVRKRALEQNPEISRQLSRAALDRCYYKLYLNLATHYLKCGGTGKAREKILAYIELYPYSPVSYLLLLMTFIPARINERLWGMKASLSGK